MAEGRVSALARLADIKVSGMEKGMIGFIVFVAIVAFIITIVYVDMRVKRNQIDDCNKNTSAFNTILRSLQGASSSQPPATK